MGFINCVTAPSILPGSHYTRGPSLFKPATWRPTRAPTWTRVVAWPHTVRLLRPAWATHGSATWPQRRVAPVRWSRAPRVTPLLGLLTTSAPAGKISLFRDFSKENPKKMHLKRKIKIRKRHKLQKNHILKYTTPF